MPVTTEAAATLVLVKLEMVFRDRVEFGVGDVMLMPITDALVVVPVPMLVVRLRITLDVRTAGALLVNIPRTWEAVPVAVSCSELATVPPTVLVDAFQVTVEPVKHLMPTSRKVPDAPRLVAEMPPTLLLLEVQAFEVKL